MHVLGVHLDVCIWGVPQMPRMAALVALGRGAGGRSYPNKCSPINEIPAGRAPARSKHWETAGVTTSLTHEADTGAARKARGAFFTPRALCDWVSQWAIRSAADVVLEPSCGDAEFLLSAGRRLSALGGSGVQLRGAELHPASAQAAARRLEEAGFEANIRVGDFFDVTPTREMWCGCSTRPRRRGWCRAGCR